MTGNRFSDLDFPTFSKIYLMKPNLIGSREPSAAAEYADETLQLPVKRQLLQRAATPATIDWAASGKVTSVKDQVSGCQQQPRCLLETSTMPP